MNFTLRCHVPIDGGETAAVAAEVERIAGIVKEITLDETFPGNAGVFVAFCQLVASRFHQPIRFWVEDDAGPCWGLPPRPTVPGWGAELAFDLDTGRLPDTDNAFDLASELNHSARNLRLIGT